MFGLPRKIVIFDTECTTWEGAFKRNWSGPGEHRELIQVGAVVAQTDDFSTTANLKMLIRPRINPILSRYCIELTGISQKDLDGKGVDFPTFLRVFSMWCGSYGLYSFDKVVDRIFDRDVLIENCDLSGLAFPFNPEIFHNINEIFIRYGIFVQQSGMASSAFGIEPKQRSHDALNDVMGLIEGLKLLKKKVA